jgi:hypothetical protein
METKEIFPSGLEAGRKFHITPNSILRCCANEPYMNTSGGYHWCFPDQYEQEKHKIEDKPYNGGQDRRVYCFELDMEFDSIQQAADHLGATHSCISKCCHLDGDRISVKGYHVCFAEDKDNYVQKVSQVISIVKCIETEQIFMSAAEAGRSVNRDASNIIAAIKRGGTCGDYHWEYIRKSISNQNRGGQNKKAVRCIETGIVYESSAEAARQTGMCASSIAEACKDPSKRTRNKNKEYFHWEYVE